MDSESTGSEATDLAAAYRRVRQFTDRLYAPLSAEDCVIQSMPDVSPTRWHLAHTTWFFETFVLARDDRYRPFDPAYAYLFNSYYNTVGEQFPRSQRGLLSRPGLDEIRRYREHVDDRLHAVLQSPTGRDAALAGVIELGLHHEQQHQELILTDIKHVLAQNPLGPVYRTGGPASDHEIGDGWSEFPEGIAWIGHSGEGFHFDNETPRHRAFHEAFALRNRPVTAGEYLEFMRQGGYQKPEYWLSLGWQTVCREGWTAPMYWVQRDGQWLEFTLSGLRPVQPDAPVCHVSYFEADAMARWAGARLPTESEWEVATAELDAVGNFADTLLDRDATIHPTTAGSAPAARPCQMFGDVWEWTASPYTAYPGYRPPDGALGEYNGKFMCNQYVLRGGSCATHSSHIRGTYRNFFPPDARWQFSGFRLARDA